MTEQLNRTMAETLELLRALAHDASAPAEAQARLRQLQQRHPATPLELVWEQESYSQAVHYDVLLRVPEAGTVSLSFCPERAVPWPLRGAQHSRENEIVRVNGETLTVQNVMNYLDFIWDEARVVTGLVDACLIEKELALRELKAEDAELQQAMDDFRRRRGLYDTATTERWFAQNGTTQEKLERLLEYQIIAAKLRDQLTAAQVETYFAQHPDAPETRPQIAAKLFEEWLAAQRQAASIEWFWGDVKRLATQNSRAQAAAK